MLLTAVAVFILTQSLVFRYAGPKCVCGGECYLSVKVALSSWRPQCARTAGLRVSKRKGTLNNRACGAALPRARPDGWPVGWLTSRRDATGRRPELCYNPLLLPAEEREAGAEREIELRTRAPFSALLCMLIQAAAQICRLRYMAS